MTLYVSYAAPGGEAPELRVDVPATKTVRSVAKAVAKLVERKHGAAPAGLRLLYAASGDAVDVDATAAAAFATETRLSAAVDAAPPPPPAPVSAAVDAAPPPAPKASKPRPSKAPPPSPRLDGLCVVAANQGLIVRAGRSLETALVGEVAFGAVVRVSGHVAGDGRCAVAGGGLEGFGSSKCLAPLVDGADPLCVAFEHALTEPDGPQASVWVRHGGAEARADAVVAAARAAGPAAWAARLTDGTRVPVARLAPIYVESGGPADGGGPPTCHWDVALRLAADVAAGARDAPDRRGAAAWAARAEVAAARRAWAAAAIASTAAILLSQSHKDLAPLHRRRAAALWRARVADAAEPPVGDERGATPAFPLVLGVLAVRDAQFCERLKPPNAPPPPPSAGAATDAELAEIALFAKLTRLPNLLLWPMDAADAAPGR